MSARSAAPIALIIEDDETVREVVGRVLKSEGYVTHEASNGVEGLELGADDYLIKPFGIRELIARVNTVLRRSTLIR